jgi:hypothetical protein
MPRRPVALAHLALPLMLGACTGAAVPPGARLPADAVSGIGDPVRAAVAGSAHAFGTGSVLAGRPAAAARALAQVEFLAAEIPAGPRWIEWSPTVGMELQGARAELRQALGIPAASPPQAVVDSLYAAARALQAGDRAAAEAALQAAEAADRGALLRHLSALPALPRTRTATALAHQEMVRVDQDSRMGGMGSNDGGKD